VVVLLMPLVDGIANWFRAPSLSLQQSNNTLGIEVDALKARIYQLESEANRMRQEIKATKSATPRVRLIWYGDSPEAVVVVNEESEALRGLRLFVTGIRELYRGSDHNYVEESIFSGGSGFTEYELSRHPSSHPLFHSDDMEFTFTQNVYETSEHIDGKGWQPPIAIRLLGKTVAHKSQWKVSFRCEWDGLSSPLIQDLLFQWSPGEYPTAAMP
jgi:outer membrane murein-binding lipoprotein Lpp